MITPECEWHGPALDTVRLVSRVGSIRLPIKPYQSVDRRLFDQHLVEKAVDLGVVFVQGARAVVMPNDHVRIEYEGSTFELRPGVVVVADGLGGSSLRERNEFQWHVSSHSPIGLGAIVQDQRAPRKTSEITMVIGAGGYVGFAPLNDDWVSIGSALPAQLVRQLGPAEAVARILRTARVQDDRIAQAMWKGVTQLTRHRRRIAHKRVLVVGDAAQYVEPLTGEGMSWAIQCASTIVPFAARVLNDVDVTRAWSVHCRRTLRSRGFICRAATRAVRSPGTFRIVANLAKQSTLPGIVSRRLCWCSK